MTNSLPMRIRNALHRKGPSGDLSARFFLLHNYNDLINRGEFTCDLNPFRAIKYPIPSSQMRGGIMEEPISRTVSNSNFFMVIEKIARSDF